MQKSRHHRSTGTFNPRTKDLSASKVAQKSLSKDFRTKRSSTHQLNQYSKLLLLQKHQDPKNIALLKRQGIVAKNIIQSVGNTRRQYRTNKPDEVEKVNHLLEVMKKKTGNSNTTVTPMTPELQNNFVAVNSELTETFRLTRTSQNNSRRSLHKKGQSIGKLYLGKNIMPQRIPNKQQRLNPFYEQPRIITENLINSKGVYNLVNAGILPSEYDFLEILNNKYQPIQDSQNLIEIKPQQVMKIDEEAETFMTNPTLMNQYEEHKKQSEADLIQSQNSKNNTQELEKKRSNKIRKTKLKKVKKIKGNDPFQKLTQILTFDLPTLVISNGKLEKDENYQIHLKQCLKNGTQTDFFELIGQMEDFVAKYNIKKIKFKPNPLFIKRVTEKYLLHSIQNFKIYGLDKTIRSKRNIMETVIIRAIEMRMMKKIKFHLKKIENLKKYYRMRKLYHEYVDKRYNFYKYRLGSFAEEQRKYIEEFVQNKMTISDYHPKIEIHVLTKEATYTEENTYYKLRERLRAHLMRLANCEAKEIIFLIDPVVVGDVKNQMELFFNTLNRLSQKLQKVNSNLPKVHIFSSKSKDEVVSYTGRTYFGISSEVLKAIKNIIKNERPVLIPYESSKLIPFICQTFNANLFGGTYTKQSIQIIFQEDQEEIHALKPKIKGVQFEKVQSKHTFQTMIRKLKTFQMANFAYEDKSKIYDLLFTKLQKPMPYRLQTKGKKQDQFYSELVTKIISHKDSMKWVFKLGRGKFSRGMAILQTVDLKIFQEKRKKPQLTESQISQLAKLMNIILGDKIILSHGTLMEKKQFLTQFLTSQTSYVEEFVQNSHKICIFGKILPNGRFIFMGSYKKHYTNGVGFGASYPAEEVNEEIIEELKEISEGLFQENVFGYVTFQLLYQEKTKKFLYLDFTPNLEEYSSLYFLYNSLFKAESLYSDYFGFNLLPRSIFYCPFLDNNGNKFESLDEFLDECRTKKIWYNPTSQEGQRFMFYQNDPSVLSLLVFSNSEFQSIKMVIDAISFLVEMGGKFYQFDKKYMQNKDSKTDGLYMMDILWKLREIRKKMEGSLIQQRKSTYG